MISSGSMATFCFYHSSGSSSASDDIDNSSNTSQPPEQPQQLLLSSWEYLTPPELESSDNSSGNFVGYRPVATILRSRRAEFSVKKEEKNAKERERVKRLNELYLTLRSILGGESRDSKLSKVPVLHAAITYMKKLAKELDRLKALARKPAKMVRPPPLSAPPGSTLFYQSPEALLEATTTHQHQVGKIHTV